MRILAGLMIVLAVTLVTSHATPTASANTGSITIIVKAIPDSNSYDTTFTFDSPFGPFELQDGESRTFIGLAADIYSISERSMNGWVLPNVICSDGSNRSGHSAYIELAPGEHVTCEFINEAVGPFPTPTTNLPSTGGPVFVTPPSTGDAGLANR